MTTAINQTKNATMVWKNSFVITFKVYITVQAALVICDFAYMRYRNDLFSGTYPLIISHPWSFYIRIHYMRVYFWSPYLSHITRSNCILF